MLALPRQQTPDSGTPVDVLAGFEHVNRFWDNERSRWVSKILPGEFYVSRSNELISTVLGSCVSACIFDPRMGLGGMNHFMLPESNQDGRSWGGDENTSTARFGVNAMELLINTLLAQGARRNHLQVKLFGGGKILAAMTDIGQKNIQFAEHYLRTEDLKLIGKDVGDIYPRKILFDPILGRAWSKKLRAVHDNAISQEELAYSRQISAQPVAGEIELF